MSFSENLQFIRAQAGITQEQLAEQLDVSRQSVSKWEGAQSFPEMDTLLKICDLYDVNLDLLLRGSVEQSRVSDTARYDAFMNRFSRRIAGAVSGIVAGVGLTGLLEGAGLPEMPLAVLFLAVVSVCVVVLVVAGIQHENFCKRWPVITDFYTLEQKDAFRQKFVWYIAGGVGAILFGLVLMLMMENAFGEAPPWDNWSVAVFMLIVAGAAWAFIYGGIQHDKYDIAKYNRINDPSPEARRQNALVSTACAVIMLLAAAIYVGLGLALGLWGKAWWVFAVGGILCGVAAVVLGPKEE